MTTLNTGFQGANQFNAAVNLTPACSGGSASHSTIPEPTRRKAKCPRFLNASIGNCTLPF